MTDLLSRNRAKVSLYIAIILGGIIGKVFAASLGFLIVALWALMLAETVDDMRRHAERKHT